MKVTLTAVANILFSLACAIVTVVGALQIHDRWQRHGPRNRPEPEVERVTPFVLDLGDTAIQSRGTPQLALIEFADFQCVFCVQFAAGAFADLQHDFVDTGVIAFAFMHYPLERIHPSAFRAAEGAECAGQQGKFWEMHKAIFVGQGVPMESRLLGEARSLNLRLADFQECLQGAVRSRIRTQIEMARGFGITTTPTFLIGRMQSAASVLVLARIKGARPYATFAKAIKDALAGKM